MDCTCPLPQSDCSHTIRMLIIVDRYAHQTKNNNKIYYIKIIIEYMIYIHHIYVEQTSITQSNDGNKKDSLADIHCYIDTIIT